MMCLKCEGSLSVYPEMSRKQQLYVLKRLRTFISGYVIKDTIIIHGKCRKNMMLCLRDLVISMTSAGYQLNGIIDYAGERNGFFVITGSNLEDMVCTRETHLRLANTNALVEELQRRGFYVKLGAVTHPEIKGAISDDGIVQETGKPPVQIASSKVAAFPA